MSVTDFVQFRRKREGRTNYKKRLIYLKSEKPRLVVRKTNKQIILQLVNYEPNGDLVICSVTSNMLKSQGWKYSYNSIPACYLTGILLAKKAKENKIAEAIPDLGLQTIVAGSKVYAAIKGAIDGGLKVPADKEVLPTDARLKGEHIANHFKTTEVPSQFSKYKTEKLDAAKMSSDIDAIKKKIMQG